MKSSEFSFSGKFSHIWPAVFRVINNLFIKSGKRWKLWIPDSWKPVRVV